MIPIEDDYKYDAFISYCSGDAHDRDWVRNWLLHRLEEADLRICIDFRDFVPGAFILKNIADAINSSCKILVVLTPAWVQSDWTTFESQFAQSRDPAGRWSRLIPLLLKRCPLPSDIRSLTGIDFTHSSDIEFQLRQLVTTLRVGDLLEVNRLLRQLKELHHQLQEITTALDAFQSIIQSIQQDKILMEIETLHNIWRQQMSRSLDILEQFSSRQLEPDIYTIVHDVDFQQRNVGESLTDNHSTIGNIREVTSIFRTKCTQYLIKVDLSLYKLANRSCNLSDRLIASMRDIV